MSRDHDIRLVLSDVAGTLLTWDKVLTDAAKAAVRDLQAAGISFAIASSRPPRGMAMLIEPLALRGAIAGFNGGMFINPDLSIIESHTLDPATAKLILQLILAQGLDVWVYPETQWLISKANAPHVAREAWTVKFEAEVVPAFTVTHLANAVKIVGVSDDVSLMASCETIAQTTLGDKASVTRSQSFYLDVTNPGANKGAVATALAGFHNVHPSQTATIEDMQNDVLMFQKAGLSIAMGNASDEVKAQAIDVTESNENEGFAKALRRFVLS